MKEQEKKIMETGNTKDVEVDLDKVGDKIVGGAFQPVPVPDPQCARHVGTIFDVAFQPGFIDAKD